MLDPTVEEIIKAATPENALIDIAGWLDDCVLEKPLSAEQRKFLRIKLTYWMKQQRSEGRVRLMEELRQKLFP